MKLGLCVVTIGTFLLILVAMFAEKSRNLSNHLTPPVTKNGETHISGCLSESEVSVALLQDLASSDSTIQQQTIAATLLDNASQSAECRKQLVSLLIAELDKTDRDLSLNRDSFFLWHYGSKLLAT